MHINSGIIFLGVIIFCIGAAIGGVIERALKRRSNLSEPLPAPDMPPTEPPPAVLPSTDVPATEVPAAVPSSTEVAVTDLPAEEKHPLAEAGDVQVLSAWRTSSNQVWLEMDGTRLNSKAEVQPGQYQRLLGLIIDLRPWLETARPAAPRPEPASQPVQPAAPRPVAQPAPVVTRPPAKPEMKDDAKVDEAAKPAAEPDSIIKQIDNVLQAKLETSTLKDRGIQLVEGPGGIVVIKDGSNEYEGIDAIPDPQVKALIQQAVADWEKTAK